MDARARACYAWDQAMSELEETMAGSLRMNDLPGGVREYQFAEGLKRRWRFDFAWPEVKVALEVEGGQWSRTAARHQRGKGMEQDIEKYNMAALMGWLVIRATTDMVNDNRAADVVRTALLLRGGI
jgi:very-short-patch-repair endonuclease